MYMGAVTSPPPRAVVSSTGTIRGFPPRAALTVTRARGCHERGVLRWEQHENTVTDLSVQGESVTSAVICDNRHPCCWTARPTLKERTGVFFDTASVIIRQNVFVVCLALKIQRGLSFKLH